MTYNIGYKQKLVLEMAKQEPITFSKVAELYGETRSKEKPISKACIQTLLSLNLIKELPDQPVKTYVAIIEKNENESRAMEEGQ